MPLRAVMIAVVTYIKSRSLFTAAVEQSVWIEPLFIGPVAFFEIRLRPAYSLLLWFRVARPNES